MGLILPSALSQKFLQSSLRPIAVIASLGLVLLSASMTMFLSSSVNHQIVDISRNYALRQQVDKVARLASNIEMSRRGYLLTLDDAQLELYRNSVLAADQMLTEFESLVGPNLLQDARVKQIRALIEGQQEEVRETAELVSSGNVDAAMAKVRDGNAGRLMDRLSQTVANFIEVEEKQLAQRNARINRMRYWMVAASIVALASAATLAFLLFTRVQRYVRMMIEGQTALRSENEILELRVQERTAELEEERRIAEHERHRVELLLQDTNHRIGNSLATVSSLLGLQMRQTSSEDARSALSAARDRVQTVSTAHRRLRLGEDMETAHVDEFLTAVIDDIREAVGKDRKFEIVTDFVSLDLKARDVTTIGIIVGELVTNAIKHAFKGRAQGHIFVGLQNGPDEVPVLIVEDDGIGWSANNIAKPSQKNGLGMLVVKQLCMQFGEEPVYGQAESGSGTRVTVRLASLVEDADSAYISAQEKPEE